MHRGDSLKGQIKKISSNSAEGKCALYVMGLDQRVSDNHALLAAQKYAIAKELPLAVVLCMSLTTGANTITQYQSKLDGLNNLEDDLAKYNIPFIVVIGEPKEKLSAVFHHTQPDAVYFDDNTPQGLKLLYDLSVVAPHIRCVISDSKAPNKGQVEPMQVVVHPYDWPGKVQTLSELKVYINTIIIS